MNSYYKLGEKKKKKKKINESTYPTKLVDHDSYHIANYKLNVESFNPTVNWVITVDGVYEERK